jgi:hypothetical protein
MEYNEIKNAIDVYFENNSYLSFLWFLWINSYEYRKYSLYKIFLSHWDKDLMKILYYNLLFIYINLYWLLLQGNF